MLPASSPTASASHHQYFSSSPQKEITYDDVFGELLELKRSNMDKDNEIRRLRQRMEAQRHMLNFIQEETLGVSHHHPFPPQQQQQQSDEDDACSMTVAAAAGDLNALSSLLKSHKRRRTTDTTTTITEVDTALLAATENQHLEAARLLLDVGKANVHVDSDSALLWACLKGDVAMVKMLMEHGADPFALECCPIRIASSRKDVAIIRQLVGGGGGKTTSS